MCDLCDKNKVYQILYPWHRHEDIRRYPWYITRDIAAVISRVIYHGYLRISRVIYHGYLRISRVNSPNLKSVCNSATLSPKREVVCVSLSPVKAQKKRKEQTPSPSSARITIDLTAEEEYASFPLTQLSEREPSTYELNEKESIVYEGEMHRSRVARQHLPRPQSVTICQLFHHHLLRPCLKSNPKKR